MSPPTDYGTQIGDEHVNPLEVVLDSDFPAKGSILVGTAPSTYQAVLACGVEGRLFRENPAKPSGVEWVDSKSAGVDSPNGDANFFWADDSRDHITVNSLVFQNYGTGIFVGTNLWTPDVFKVVARMTSAANTGTVRLRDITNNQTLAEVTISGITKQVYTDLTLTNLPAGEAIVELQAVKTTGPGNVELYAAGFYNLVAGA